MPCRRLQSTANNIEATDQGQRWNVALTRLSLDRFRSFRALNLDLDHRPVVLTGANGAGKTNILEAISLLAPGSGLRQSKLSDIDLRLADNIDGASWAVYAEATTPQGTFSLGTGRDPLAPQRIGRERRICRIDGAPVRSQSDFTEILSIQWLVPSMDRLFDDGATARRRFMDRLVVGIDPAQGERIAAYETAMRERSRLLRGEIEAQGEEKDRWLDGLEAEMAEQAAAIGAARLEAVRLLKQFLAEAVGRFPRADLEIIGHLEDWLLTMGALAAEERLQDCLRQSRASDAISNTTQWGAHRSDFAIFYAGRALGRLPLPAGDCSTGEQRALLISIVLAQARLALRIRGQAPILLLDEALAHLDDLRRDALFEEIVSLGAQAWMTGWEKASFKGLLGKAQFFHLADGQAQAR